MKNAILGFASDWFIEPVVIKATKESLPLIKEFYNKSGMVEHQPTPLRALISEPLKEVYAMPLFTEKYCSILLDEVKRFGFQVNDEEDELRQMPELVLNHSLPEAYNALVEVTKSILNPVFNELWKQAVNGFNIQVANYNPRDKRQGAWHHDFSADITVVVPLNTGGYEGGGTEFWGRGKVEPIPTGHALIFPSLTHMHRGMPVTQGDRFLLVFWLKVNHGKD